MDNKPDGLSDPDLSIVGSTHSKDLESRTANKWKERMANYAQTANNAFKSVEMLHPGTQAALANIVKRLSDNLNGFESTDFRKLLLIDYKNGADAAGLIPLEDLIIFTAFPTHKGHKRMDEATSPEVYRQFVDICLNAKATDDKYVKRYLAEHDNVPMIPRVIIVDDPKPGAVATVIPHCEPFIVVSDSLLKSNTPSQVANVLRHKLAHVYKMAREHNLKKMVVGNIATLGAGRRWEEKRADLFAPRTPQDLRDFADHLKKSGDTGQEFQDRIQTIIGVLVQHGLLESVVQDVNADIKGKLPNWKIAQWGTDKVGQAVQSLVNRALKKQHGFVDPSHSIGELVNVNVGPDYADKKMSTHPALNARLKYIEEAAIELEARQGKRPGFTHSHNSSGRKALDYVIDVDEIKRDHVR